MDNKSEYYPKLDGIQYYSLIKETSQGGKGLFPL